jgi:hypothetical protein
MQVIADLRPANVGGIRSLPRTRSALLLPIKLPRVPGRHGSQ